jgi:hypothetical protein
MNTKPKTLEELKEECIASLRAESDGRLTTILPDTVLDGIAWGMAKLAQHIITDTAYLESKFFPEFATENLLDAHATRIGLDPRRGATNSTVTLQFLADTEIDKRPTYPAGTKVKTVNGQVYETVKTVKASENRGICFVDARSQKIGPVSAVDTGELTMLVDTAPTGHLSVTNVTLSVGGFAEEHDDLFRYRIQAAKHILSVNTAAFYEALILKLFPHVIRVRCRTIDMLHSKYIINVLRDDGSYFTTSELQEIKEAIQPYLPIHDIDAGKLDVKNFEYVYLYVYVSAQFDTTKTATLKNTLNKKLNEYLDYRFWPEGQKVEWEELVRLFRNTDGIVEVNDSRISPPNDVVLSVEQLPKIALLTLQYEVVGEENQPDIPIDQPPVDIRDGLYSGLIVLRGNATIVSTGTAFDSGFDTGFE